MEQKVKTNQKYFYKINMYCTDKIYEYEENFLLLADFFEISIAVSEFEHYFFDKCLKRYYPYFFIKLTF